MNTIRELIERALTALDELETAMYENDNRRIGARLYELRHALKKILEDVTP